MTWHDRMTHDPALAAFVRAQIGQAVVELAALKVEHAHALAIIDAQKARLAALEPKGKKR
jgi:hypothetical protein